MIHHKSVAVEPENQRQFMDLNGKPVFRRVTPTKPFEYTVAGNAKLH
jgi:hypothetical protein